MYRVAVVCLVCNIKCDICVAHDLVTAHRWWIDTDLLGSSCLPSGRVGLEACVACVCRANAQQPKLFVGMILILIFAEALALYGLIGALLASPRAQIINFHLLVVAGASVCMAAQCSGGSLPKTITLSKQNVIVSLPELVFCQTLLKNIMCIENGQALVLHGVSHQPLLLS